MRSFGDGAFLNTWKWRNKTSQKKNETKLNKNETFTSSALYNGFLLNQTVFTVFAFDF